jgi:hypothetical protein
MENVGRTKVFNTKPDKLYNIAKRDFEGPKDVAHFIVELQVEFPNNIPFESVEKIYEYINDEHYTSQQWVVFFKKKFPKILKEYKNFEAVFQVIITLMDKKLNKLGGMNKFADKLGKFTDYLGDKLNFEDSNNNSSDPQNVISNLDPFNPNFDLSTFNNQQIEINDDQIEFNNDDDDSDSDSEYPKVVPSTKEVSYQSSDHPFHPPSQPPPEEKIISSVDNILNFINTSVTTNSNIPLPSIPYTTLSDLGPLPPLPAIYTTPSNLLPLPVHSAIYLIPKNFNLPPPPPPPNVSSKNFNPNDIFSLTSSGIEDINEYENNEDNEDNENEKNKIVFGAQYLTKEVAWSLTNINRNYRMKKISLKNIAQQRDLLKQEYKNFDLQHEEYTHNYFNRLYTERLWMRPIYIDFKTLSFKNYPKVWTEEKGEIR